jgi:hypothetical protein
MCGRFSQRYTWREIHQLYDLTGAARNLQAHNIAPTDPVDVVRPTAGGTNELVSMRWGLIPYWWKKPLKQLPATFNARAESVAGKPIFRDAFKRRQCIIPASGYYEWIARPDGKQPYFISAADGGVLSFAGLWDRWRSPARKLERAAVPPGCLRLQRGRRERNPQVHGHRVRVVAVPDGEQPVPCPSRVDPRAAGGGREAVGRKASTSVRARTCDFGCRALLLNSENEREASGDAPEPGDPGRPAETVE